jgi:hypothetical protein
MKYLLLIVLDLMFTSCGGLNFMNGSEPDKRSFEYYDPRFKIETVQLKTNRKYIRQDPGSVSILVFFPDGFLNEHITTSVEKADITRRESGVIKGYFKIKEDSIYFTTKSYYRHKPTSYRGLMKADTLDLEVYYPGKTTAEKEIYLLK